MFFIWDIPNCSLCGSLWYSAWCWHISIPSSQLWWSLPVVSGVLLRLLGRVLEVQQHRVLPPVWWGKFSAYLLSATQSGNQRVLQSGFWPLLGALACNRKNWSSSGFPGVLGGAAVKLLGFVVLWCPCGCVLLHTLSFLAARGECCLRMCWWNIILVL